MRRNYNKINLTNLANLVVNANFRSDGSPEEQLQRFINKLVKIFDTVAPVKPKKIRDTKKKLTITENTKQLMRRRDQLYSTMRNQPESKAEYSILKKKIRKQIYEDTRKWDNSSIENKGLWSTMKIIKPTEPEKSINQTPDELNNYFNSNTNPMDRQPTVTTPPEANQNPIMKLHSVTAVDLFQAWKTIKNKTNTKEDYNGISFAMLNLIISCPNVYDAIVNLINQSIKSFTFPNALKTSVIAPIPKIPSPSKPSDYRPISVQLNVSKLYEKCVYNQIAVHMLQNNSTLS